MRFVSTLDPFNRGWIVAALAAVTLAGCSAAPAPTAGGSQPANKPAVTVRLGYFPNITHSQALVGVARGDFQKALGTAATLDTKVFNAGPSVIEALFAGQLDLAYIGPNPAINGYVKSDGAALRIIAGATSGGAALIVRSAANISKPEDLAGKRLASPQLGNTQDVALRAYLAEHGLKPKDKGGDVEVIPTDNPQILDLFKQDQIDGAWVPEPWASRLIVDGGGKLFLDERDLWPDGEFVTAHIIASTAFLKDHPDLVKAFLQAHVEITLWEQQNPDQARQQANDQIKKLTGKSLPQAVIDGALSRMQITYDPISASLVKSAESAYTAGFLKTKPDLSGIYDLTLLNEILTAKGLPSVH
ncbi:MAG: ABC transporter substrate-binding protein [Chloroflexi bacterium]|nr:ABC transporter substrate-binding protein [Chloroflexota bacterium]